MKAGELCPCSLMEKHSFPGNFTHVGTLRSARSKSKAINYMRSTTQPQAGAQSHSEGPGREVPSRPTPDLVLHQVLPFTASPNTSKEVFLYSPGRSVNWPAASKAGKLTLKGPLPSQARGGEPDHGESGLSPYTSPDQPFQFTPKAGS